VTGQNLHPDEIQFALWQPRWHRLDQSLSVGLSGRWWFYACAGDTTRTEENRAVMNLQLFNRTVSEIAIPVVRTATVVGIEHPVLGQLSAIATDGLDYVFRSSSGVEYIVNADEQPGTVYDMDEVEIDDWSVRVTFHKLSDPVADLT